MGGLTAIMSWVTDAGVKIQVPGRKWILNYSQVYLFGFFLFIHYICLDLPVVFAYISNLYGC